jgi:hypothetical protein
LSNLYTGWIAGALIEPTQKLIDRQFQTTKVELKKPPATSKDTLKNMDTFHFPK